MLTPLLDARWWEINLLLSSHLSMADNVIVFRCLSVIAVVIAVVMGIVARFFCTGTRLEPINVQHWPGRPSQLRRFHTVQFIGSSSPRMFCSNGLTPCMLCVQIYCVLFLVDYYLVSSQLWIQDWVGLYFWNPCASWVLLRVWLPQTINVHRLFKFLTQK